MMKIAVLDDEKQAADVLVSYLRRYEEKKMLTFEISVFNAAEVLLENYSCGFNILFMDIEMAGINGLQAAKLIRVKDEHVVIVFITNMAQFAIQGYDVGAVDFILKPVTYEKFLLKIEKIFRRLPEENDETLVLRTTVGIINQSVSAVKYIETSKNYVYYHIGSNTYKVRSTMSDALEKLSAPIFVQISNCNVVNMKYISKIAQNSVDVGGTILHISRSKKAEFMQKYLSFMEKV